MLVLSMFIVILAATPVQNWRPAAHASQKYWFELDAFCPRFAHVEPPTLAY